MRRYDGAARRVSEPEKNETSMADEADQDHGGFFVISKVVKSGETLQGWVEWFRELHIPCAVEKRRGGGFNLWREGEEIGGKKSPISLAQLRRKKIILSFGL